MENDKDLYYETEWFGKESEWFKKYVNNPCEDQMIFKKPKDLN